MYETYNYICRIVGLCSEPFDQPSWVCGCVDLCGCYLPYYYLIIIIIIMVGAKRNGHGIGF